MWSKNRLLIAVCGIIAVTASCAQALNEDDINRISSQNSVAFNHHLDESINCSNTYPFPQKQKVSLETVFSDMARETREIEKVLDALDKCHIEADMRLKSQLWGNLVEVNSTHTQILSDWKTHNYDAIQRYDSENTVCQQRYMIPVGKEFEQGRPKPQKAGDDAFNRQARILIEALDKWAKCSVEAAARLRAQLW